VRCRCQSRAALRRQRNDGARSVRSVRLELRYVSTERPAGDFPLHPLQGVPIAGPTGLHGLKKGGLRRLAEAHATTHELLSVSGHRTLSQLQIYTEEVDRKKMADSAIEKRIKADGLANLATFHLQTKTQKGGK
jgi:hypothetical protein